MSLVLELDNDICFDERGKYSLVVRIIHSASYIFYFWLSICLVMLFDYGVPYCRHATVNQICITSYVLSLLSEKISLMSSKTAAQCVRYIALRIYHNCF